MNNVSQEQEKIYFGLDISQKTIEIFVLKGEKGVPFGKILNNQKSLNDFFDKVPFPSKTITVALETGTHSAWISHCLEQRGYEVIVAHARDLAFIYKGDKKSDRIDAEKLARVARADKKLLHPVRLMSKTRQEALLAIKARDLLMKERTCIVNAIRGFVRSLGIDDAEYSIETISKMYSVLPKEIRQNLRGLFSVLTAINNNISSYDKRLKKIAEEYPETKILQQVKGVGPIIALSFALIISDPNRFSSKECASYLGLVPKRDQSGETDKQLGITKSGNKLLRRLLVQGAQYIMGPFGEDCDLRDFGNRIAQRGGRIAKKKATIAVARKLAITMLALWRNPDVKYDPHFKAANKQNRCA
ncbi:MAG: IS110 family transposase [Lentisphaeria bacterium]|nr:IS110 family transposase [Lentisphaeria bacterium]